MLRKLLFSWKNKLGVLLVIILGYFLCITITSIMINQLVLVQKTTNNDNMGGKENYSVLSISTNNKNSYKGDPIDIINEFSKYGKVDVLKLGKETVSSGKNSVSANIYPTSFVKKTDWTPLLDSGRYFTPEESCNGSSMVLVGKNIASKLKLKVDNSLKFYGKNYKVIGIMGPKNMTTEWDDVISIPVKSLPEDYLSILKGKVVSNNGVTNTLNLQIFFRVSQSQYEKVKRDILNNLKNNELDIEKTEKTQTETSIIQESSRTVIVLIPIFISALFNVINISFFWITDRKKEITIKKALGATNKSIINTVRSELLSIGLIATILSFIVQVSLKGILESTLNGLDMSLEFSWTTFTICILLSLGLGYLTTILPADRILSMKPAEALRYE